MPAIALLLARRRIWILAAAALLGMAAAGALSPSAAHAPDPAGLVAGIVADAIPAARAASVDVVVAATEDADAKADDAETAAEPPAASGTESAGKPKKRKATVGITIDDDEGKVRIRGGNGTREYDSFDSFVEKSPWIAGLVFMATFLVLVTPLLIIALVIWYKMRKTRMLNETMVRLAEKGVVPSTEAFDAISRDASNPLAAGPTVSPLYERARAVRERAVWSDLRKGVICGAIGLGFTFYSIFDDGSPNFVGLVLLFVGLAYVVLWYFEDRQMSAPGNRPPPPSA